jgi:hypothetical protein
MSRFDSRSPVAAILFLAAFVPTASAQLALHPVAHKPGAAAAAGPLAASLVSTAATPSSGDLHGLIRDDRGEPLEGAVVSALGSTTAFAITDREGRFTFRGLPAGPYLVRVHLQGYLAPRPRVLQVQSGARHMSTIALTPRAGGGEEPRVLTAGVGPVDGAPAPDTPAEHDHDEVAWRLRHSKRSVLKDAQQAIAQIERDRTIMGESLTGLGRAVGDSARIAGALFADLSVTGQIDLLTTASFESPQDLFAIDAGEPRGVAYLSLEAPGARGDWTVRGTITQGDVESWILAASYVRRDPGAHQYEAGVSYSTQRYFGGNAEALAAIRDGGRNVGSMYAYDDWKVASRLNVGYGAKFANYDYLEDGGLLSPRASVTLQPSSRDSLRVRATAAHRETAPGAEEFLPPVIGPWLPPERTFSHVSRGRFEPERLEHIEVAAEREWAGEVLIGVRAFAQSVQDQLVTVFGMADSSSLGHYQVGSAGDFEARGWGLSVSRAVGEGVRASVDYTVVSSERRRLSPDAHAISRVGVVLPDDERIHDVTASVESVVAPTATRVYVLYKMNSAFAVDASPLATARFNVQVNQSLPFLNFASAQWEMLAAVSNLFRADLVDASVYDELLVVRPPKRVLGGVTVRF